MMKMRLILLLTFLIFGILTVGAQTRQQIKTIDSLMQVASARRVFNGNIIVAEHGKIIYDKAWGYADAGKNKMLNTGMLFDIGSISKEFNGVSIMLLKERGKLRLEGPVSKYITGLPMISNGFEINNIKQLYIMSTSSSFNDVKKIVALKE